MKELELEEKVRLLQKEVNLLGEDVDRAKLNIEETKDSLIIEIEVLKAILEEAVPDLEEKYSIARDNVLREIVPE
jgi:hypothetical protein